MAAYRVDVPSGHILSFTAAISSDVPLGGGLSSSAALEVSVATLLQEITRVEVSGVERALRWGRHFLARVSPVLLCSESTLKLIVGSTGQCRGAPSYVVVVMRPLRMLMQCCQQNYYGAYGIIGICMVQTALSIVCTKILECRISSRPLDRRH